MRLTALLPAVSVQSSSRLLFSGGSCPWLLPSAEKTSCTYLAVFWLSPAQHCWVWTISPHVSKGKNISQCLEGMATYRDLHFSWHRVLHSSLKLKSNIERPKHFPCFALCILMFQCIFRQSQKIANLMKYVQAEQISPVKIIQHLTRGLSPTAFLHHKAN